MVKIWQFLLPSQPHCFLQPEVTGIYLPGAEILGCGIWPEAGIAGSQGSPPDFHPPHECGAIRSAAAASSPPVCYSTPPTRLDGCGSFRSLVVGLPYSLIFRWFWILLVLRSVILSMLVQGGKHVYLRLHPDWKSPVILTLLFLMDSDSSHRALFLMLGSLVSSLGIVSRILSISMITFLHSICSISYAHSSFFIVLEFFISMISVWLFLKVLISLVKYLFCSLSSLLSSLNCLL